MTWPASTAGPERCNVAPAPCGSKDPTPVDTNQLKPPHKDSPGDAAEFQRYHLRRYAEIGMALSGEENIPRLLEMIVYEARELTNADAGTLYMVNEERSHLDFVIMQNETMGTFLGGRSGDTIHLPAVPLCMGGEENHAHVSSHVALTGEIVNIPDVYQSSDFDFSGTRDYDRATGYRSRSMLVIPMRNHENDVIGVLQLLNARDPGGEVREFADEYISLVAALASQAAVTLTKTRLIQGLKELLEAFIRSIAAAIEEKSRYTGGHIARVSRLACLLAEEINHSAAGPFRDVHFSPQELEEIRLAGWLHDIGKIITPEFVVDKSTKLETICDRAALVALRFDCIRKCREAEHLQAVIAALQGGVPDQAPPAAELEAALQAIEADKAFVLACNEPGYLLDQAGLERLRRIAEQRFVLDGVERPWLEPEELQNLSITRGTLNPGERTVIESHADLTYRMLAALPFPKHLSRVPEFAGHHHEKCDGSGYPFGLTAAELSLQARIMAVADVFEALTARDRPYKKPMPLSQALRILGEMKDSGHIDPQVHDLLVRGHCLETYVREELDPQQVDIRLENNDRGPQSDALTRLVERLLAQGPGAVAGRTRPLLLIVDDSETSRMLLSYYLNGTGLDLDLAEDALEALRRLAERVPDAVLVDLELQPMDGYELARRIREWEQRHGLPPRPLLAMAAPFLPHQREQILGAGFTQHITRPFGKEELRSFLGAHLPTLNEEEKGGSQCCTRGRDTGPESSGGNA